MANKPRREKSVHPAPFGAIELEIVGEGAKTARGLDPLGLSGELVLADLGEPQRIVADEQGGDLRLALLGLERAGGIDQPAARLEQGCGIVEQPRLQHGKRGDVLGRLDIGYVGVAADRAGRRAGGIEQHRVEFLFGIEGRGVADHEFSRKTEPVEILPHQAEPCLRAVDGRDVSAGERELRRLAAGRRAEIGHAFASHIAHQARRQGGGDILYPPRAVVEPGHFLDAPLGQKPDASRRHNPARQSLGPQLRIAFDGEVERRLDEMRRADRMRAVLAPIGHPARPQPIRRIDPRRIEARGDSLALGCHAPEHGVGELAVALGPGIILGERHSKVDSRMRRRLQEDELRRGRQ